MTAISLFEQPRSRADSPWTSWAAARSITNLRESQAAVLAILEAAGPLSLSQLVTEYQRGDRMDLVPIGGADSECLHPVHEAVGVTRMGERTEWRCTSCGAIRERL